MKTINITNARRNLYNIVEDTIVSHKPVQILSKQGGVVLISAEDWEAIQETVYLNSIKGFKESLEESDLEPTENWITEGDLNW